MPLPILTINKLSKSVKLKNQLEPILTDISLLVSPNERLGIFGPSGSGKTTLARLIKGYLKPTEGFITFLGQNKSSKELLRDKEIQLVFQNPYESLSPKQTCKQMILDFYPLSSDESKESLRKRALSLSNELNINNELLNRFPHQLSGGERQRVALLRALLVHPKILVCDEILSSLDQPLQEQTLELLLKYQLKHKTSIIFISHDLSLIQKFCKRVLLLSNGRADLFDSPQALLLSESVFIQDSIKALDWLN